MSNTTFGHSPAELEEKLATYWRLVEERERVEKRIARANAEKDSVSERIFRKVISEYEAALEAMAARLDPLRDELDELRRETAAELEATEAVIQELEDEVAESRFRQRVGEFDEAAMNEAIKRLEPRVVETRQLRDQLNAQLEAMDRRRQSEPAPPPATEAPQPVTAEPAAVTPPETENLQHWADQLEPVELSASSEVTAAESSEEDDDPLRALSDPAPSRDHGAPRQPAGNRVQPAPSGHTATMARSYPSLVIRSGVHQGKIVPLLPMTMSIGREHDNNIELKDPDVARYHARILYEEGRFFVEDLESSSGTWVNGVRQRRTALTDGDIVRIGETELRFEFA